MLVSKSHKPGVRKVVMGVGLGGILTHKMAIFFLNFVFFGIFVSKKPGILLYIIIFNNKSLFFLKK
jgi:hypothetical protein